MHRKPRRLATAGTGAWCAICALGVFTAPTAGQPADSPEQLPRVEADDHSTLELQITPGVWLPRLGGEIKLGETGAARQIGFEDELDLNGLEPTFNGELSLRSDNGRGWSVLLSGFSFSTDNDGQFTGGRAADFGSLTVNPGDSYRAEFEFDSMAAEVGLVTIPLVDSLDGDHGSMNPNHHNQTTLLRVSPHVGVRYVSIEQELSLPGSGQPRERESERWFATYVGGDVMMRFDTPTAIPLVRSLTLEGAFAAGPAISGSGFIWQVRGGLTLNFSESAGMQIGYRLVELDLEQNDFEIDGGLQGLFIAGRVTF